MVHRPPVVFRGDDLGRPGWEHWFLQVTRKAIKADYLAHHDTPGATRNHRTHLVHATCHRSKQPPRQAGNTVMQQAT